MQEYISALVVLLLAGVTAAGSPQQQNLKPTSTKPIRTLGPCQSCRILVTSFLNGMERTAITHNSLNDKGISTQNEAQHNDEMKDLNSTTLVEDINNGNVNAKAQAAVSEGVRYEDIIKGLCAEIKVGREQCLELATNHSSLLEEWWQSHEKGSDDILVTWLCIDRLKVCCPWSHYGAQCTPCSGFPSNVCSNHGKCKGNGTRKGNGACLCDKGYIGDSCNSCEKMHYEAYRDEDKVVCSQCHRACLGGCGGAGPKSCDSCNEGWETDDEKGCLDVNECLMIEKSCKRDEFCVNTEGSYACFVCDRSCDGCYGDGPDMCEKCAEGYTLIDKLCIDNTSSARDRKIDIARYLTYFGLCVSTCIIFQKNMAIASIIGVAVGMYIATSEYLLSEQP